MFGREKVLLALQHCCIQPLALFRRRFAKI